MKKRIKLLLLKKNCCRKVINSGISKLKNGNNPESNEKKIVLIKTLPGMDKIRTIQKLHITELKSKLSPCILPITLDKFEWNTFKRSTKASCTHKAGIATELSTEFWIPAFATAISEMNGTALDCVWDETWPSCISLLWPGQPRGSS